MFLLRLFRTLKHLEQLIQFRSHDNFRTAVPTSAFGCFIIIHRHIFTATTRLNLQRIHIVILDEDTNYGSGTDHT